MLNINIRPTHEIKNIDLVKGVEFKLLANQLDFVMHPCLLALILIALEHMLLCLLLAKVQFSLCIFPLLVQSY